MQRLYDLYAPKMMGVCFRYVHDRETALDLLHDGFITTFSKIRDFRGEGSFEGWLRRIFVTTALMHLRKKNVLDRAEPVEAADSFGDGEYDILEKLSSAQLLECVGRLPEGYRTILNLYAVEGYSHREIAGMLGIDEGTSRSQYARAKVRLRNILKEKGMI